MGLRNCIRKLDPERVQTANIKWIIQKRDREAKRTQVASANAEEGNKEESRSPQVGAENAQEVGKGESRDPAPAQQTPVQ